jgi:hypothetical protein
MKRADSDRRGQQERSLSQERGEVMAGKRYRWVLALSASLLITSCATIPSQTPELIRVATEVVENESESVAQALRTTLDQAEFTNGMLGLLRKDLEAMDTSGLSEEQQQIVKATIEGLRSEELQLGMLQKAELQGKPARTRQVFSNVASSLRLVHEVVGGAVDRKLLFQDLIHLLEAKGGEAE